MPACSLAAPGISSASAAAACSQRCGEGRGHAHRTALLRSSPLSALRVGAPEAHALRLLLQGVPRDIFRTTGRSSRGKAPHPLGQRAGRGSRLLQRPQVSGPGRAEEGRVSGPVYVCNFVAGQWRYGGFWFEFHPICGPSPLNSRGDPNNRAPSKAFLKMWDQFSRLPTAEKDMYATDNRGRYLIKRESKP